MSRLSLPISERDHFVGELDAAATLLEYGDFECRSCGRAHPILRDVVRRAGSALCFVFRHFPQTETHPHALLAAQASEAAGAQAMFWPMHDALFENQGALDLASILGYASTLRLNMRRFASDLENGVYLDKVKADFHSGVRSGVNGTPSFYIDGFRFDGAWDVETLTAAIEIAARQKGGLSASRP